MRFIVAGEQFSATDPTFAIQRRAVEEATSRSKTGRTHYVVVDRGNAGRAVVGRAINGAWQPVCATCAGVEHQRCLTCDGLGYLTREASS